MSKRSAIGDGIIGMLKEEVVYICPIQISKDCERFEAVTGSFTNHHIDGDASNSTYWNLIRLCEHCHVEIHLQNNASKLKRQIKIRKKNLSIQYFGPLAINVLRLAHKHRITSATPAMAVKLLEKEYLRVAHDNIVTVGSAPHATFQDYAITQAGDELVENLIGER